MADSIHLDAASLRSIGKQFRGLDPKLRRGFSRELRAAGERIASRAREDASWSTRIPGTIRVAMAGPLTVVVRAGGGRDSPAPHARAYEHGGSTGDFRHPVFADATGGRGDWTWVSEPARPFLQPAQVEEMPATVAAVEAALQHIVDATGEAGT